MKRLVFSAVFICLACGICTFEQATVKNAYVDMMSSLEEVFDAKDDEEMAKKAKELDKEWSSYYDKLSLVEDHENLVPLTETVNSIKNSAKSKNGEVDEEKILDAKSQLETIKKSSKISFKNIF